MFHLSKEAAGSTFFFGKFTGFGAGSLGLLAERMFSSVKAAGDLLMLSDTNQGLRDVVHHEANGEDELNHAKRDG